MRTSDTLLGVYRRKALYMPTYSVRASGDLADEIEAFADAYDGSRSDALRELLERGIAYEDIQRERDRLQRAQTQLIEQREEHGELVAFAQEERSLAQRREEREERRARRRDAPVWLKLAWSIIGGPEYREKRA